MKMRLDKYLGNAGIGTRSQVQKMVKKSMVTVEGEIVKNPSFSVPEGATVRLNGEEILYKEFYYFVLNKPAGFITATEDYRHETVIDLLDFEDQNKKLAPVGRLDKDTEGLLILTNDGKMTHRLLSPKKHVSKVYYAEILGKLDDNAVEKFENGITLDDGTEFMSAKLEIISENSVYVTIMEGKFHQVKRMIAYVGAEVAYLKRIKMGNLCLPDDLACGEYRELTDAELLLLQGGEMHEI